MSGREPPSQIVPSIRGQFSPSELPWYMQPSSVRTGAIAPFLGSDPETIRRLAEARVLARRGGLAEEDPYAEIGDADVPEWGRDERDTEQRIASYQLQMESNPGQFAINFDEQAKGRNTKTVVMIFQLKSIYGCDGAEKDADIRKYYTSRGVNGKKIQILKPAPARYTLQPLGWDGEQLSLDEDDEYEFNVPPGFKWVAVPVTQVAGFLEHTKNPKSTLKQYKYKDKDLFLIKKDAFSQKYYNPLLSKKAFGQF